MVSLLGQCGVTSLLGGEHGVTVYMERWCHFWENVL